MVEATTFVQLFRFLWSYMHQAFGVGVDSSFCQEYLWDFLVDFHQASLVFKKASDLSSPVQPS